MGTELVLDDLAAGRRVLVLQAGRGELWNPVVTELAVFRALRWWQTRPFWGAMGATTAALLVWLLYLRRTGPGSPTLEPTEDYDDTVVHLEDLDTDELRVSQEDVDRARRNIFGDRRTEDGRWED
jgi:hypothetical protein